MSSEQSIFDLFPVKLNYDELIIRLVNSYTHFLSKGSKNATFFLSLDEVKTLCWTVIEVFKTESMLIRIEGNANLNVCGDIHGQYETLITIFDTLQFPSEENRYLFLGDYVDRGRNSLEVICLLFLLKCKNPKSIYLLRGNHESVSITQTYGFENECKNRHKDGKRVYKAICDTFRYMSPVALVGGKILCMHGGIPKIKIQNLQEIHNIQRPVPENGTDPSDEDQPRWRSILSQMLWNDPLWSSDKQFDPSKGKMIEFVNNEDRGEGTYKFSKEILEIFLGIHNLLMIVRAHEVQQDGYKFFADQKLVSLFSARNYADKDTNDGAVLLIRPQDINATEIELVCSLKIFKAKAL